MFLEFDDMPPMPTKSQMMTFLELAEVTEHLAVDTEGDFKVSPTQFLGISCGFAPLHMGMYFPVGHLEADVNIDDETFKFLQHVIESNSLKIMQNAMHDIGELSNLGFDMSGPFVDTMVIAHMIDENVINKGLDYLHKYYCGGIGKDRDPLMQDFIDRHGWRYVPAHLMSAYATQDAIATSELWVVLKPLYEEQFGPLFSEELTNAS